MESLKQALTIERNRLFVGRGPELTYIQNWLTQQDSPTEVVFISGMGGIGKSVLMLKFLNIAQDENMLCIWLDGRACAATPSGFLGSLHSSQVQNSHLIPTSKTSMEDIVISMSQQRTLLCIDNYDHLHPIEGWLRQVFLPELSAKGILVILAARQELAIEWQNDLAWRKRVRQMRLGPFSRPEAKEFYTNIGVYDNFQIEHLIYETKGLPLAMALSADRVNLTKVGSDTSQWPVSLLVSAELLREVAESDLQEILDLLCILPQSNQELLGRLLGTPLTTWQLHQLTRLSFVRPTMEGFALHDVARVHLQDDFLHREPARYHTLRYCIVKEMIKELKTAGILQKKQIAASLLSICRDFFQINMTPVISTNPQTMTMDSFRQSDLPHLHGLIKEQARLAISLESDAKIHELLDAIAQQFPENLRVFRSENGIPLTFTVGLLLYRETINFLEPFIPHVLENCYPLEIDSMKQLRLDEADTHYQLLAAATSQDPHYSFYELNGILLVDHISTHSVMGLRCTVITKLEETVTFMRGLGFHITPFLGLPEAHPSYGAWIIEFDLRSLDFGDFVIALLQVSENEVSLEVEPVSTEADIKTILKLGKNPDSLGQTTFARKVNSNGFLVQQKLLDLLHQGPPQAPLNKRMQDLLRLMYDEPDLNVEMASSRLHISRATYYRYQREALRHLNELLSKSFDAKK